MLKLRGILSFFSSPAVYGWDGWDKASEPDLSGFVSRLSFKHYWKPDESGF